MGSFNAICGLSGLPIQAGDRAGFVPVGSSKFRTPSVGPLMAVPCQFWAPVLPPVYGTYDGYGGLKDLEESDVAALLEEVSSRPIKTALSALADSRGFYDSHGERFSTYVTEPGKLAEHDAPLDEVLESLGFAAQHTFAGHEFELQKYKLLLQDGQARKIRLRGFTQDIDPRLGNRTEYVLAHFAGLTGVTPGVAEADQKAAKLARSTTGMFIHPAVLEGMSAALIGDEVHGRSRRLIESGWDELMQEFERSKPGHPKFDGWNQFPSTWSWNGIIGSMRERTAWDPEQYGYLEHLSQESTLSMLQVVDVAQALGRTLGPTQIVSDIDSHDFARAMHGIAAGILQRREEG